MRSKRRVQGRLDLYICCLTFLLFFHVQLVPPRISPRPAGSTEACALQVGRYHFAKETRKAGRTEFSARKECFLYKWHRLVLKALSRHSCVYNIHAPCHCCSHTMVNASRVCMRFGALGHRGVVFVGANASTEVCTSDGTKASGGLGEVVHSSQQFTALFFFAAESRE